MKISLVFLLSLLLLAIVNGLNAQTIDLDTQVVKGRIVSNVDNSPLAYVNIFVHKKGRGTISDQYGMFRIKVQNTDTISVSMLGYHKSLFVLQPETDYADTIIEIRLLPRVYELGSVDVIALNRQKQFEYDLIHLKLPVNQEYANAVRNFPFATRDIPLRQVAPSAEALSGSVISALYNTFSKEAVEKKKKKKIQLVDKVDSVLLAKVNVLQIEEITNLDRKEINIFLRWCSFSLGFVEETPDYELSNIIRQKYARYLKQKRSE